MNLTPDETCAADGCDDFPRALIELWYHDGDWRWVCGEHADDMLHGRVVRIDGALA